MGSMEGCTIKFAVEKENGVVSRIGKSTVLMPKINFKGGSVKWFDDRKLIRRSDVA